MNREHVRADISRRIWDSKYRFRELGEIRDQSVEDTWRRVARALASVEKTGCAEGEQRFYSALEGFEFPPAAGAARRRSVSAFPPPGRCRLCTSGTRCAPPFCPPVRAAAR